VFFYFFYFIECTETISLICRQCSQTIGMYCSLLSRYVEHSGTYSLCLGYRQRWHKHTLAPSPTVWCTIGLPLRSSFLLEYSSEYLSEYSSTR